MMRSTTETKAAYIHQDEIARTLHEGGSIEKMSSTPLPTKDCNSMILKFKVML